MAEFIVVDTFEPLTRAGVSGTLETEVAGHKLELIVTYAEGVGVVEWYSFAPEQHFEVSWTLSPELAQLAADHVVRVHAGDKSAARFSWSPPVEFGVAWSPRVDRLNEGAQVYGSEAAARGVSRGTGRPLVARLAPGPWSILEVPS